MNAQAVAEARTLVQSGMSANKAAQQVGDKYGVSRQAVQAWAKKAGTPLGTVASETATNARRVAEQEYRARRAGLRLKLLDAAEFAVQQFKVAEGREVQAYAVACGIFIDKMRLEEGEATSRTEYSDRDGFAAEVARLAAEMDALPVEG